MKDIKNIIFDLGGVILNIDYNKPIQEFEKLGIGRISDLYSKKSQTALFDLLETGKLDETGFVEELQFQCNDKPSHQQIVDAWNSIILDFPLRRLQILQQLQIHFNTFLLSNTNEIHERAFNKVLEQTCGAPGLAVFFHKIYFSHRVGLRKPDPAIFELVLQENRLLPHETLFIDDSIQHIESARKLGLQTIHVTDGMTMEEHIFKAKT